MAKHIKKSFKKKEWEMWFIIMIPFSIFGGIMLYFSDPSNRHIPLLIVLIGYCIYYSWRYRYRKKYEQFNNKQDSSLK